MRVPTLWIAVAAIVASATLPAQARETQLNVEIEGDGGATVRISLPLSSIDSAAAFIPTRAHSNSHIEIDGARWTTEDLRRAWNELRRDANATVLRVTDDDARIRLSQHGGMLRVTIDEDDGDRVELHLPSRAVDALLGGEGDELEIAAALHVMAELKRGELVAISAGDERVRVWVGSD